MFNDLIDEHDDDSDDDSDDFSSYPIDAKLEFKNPNPFEKLSENSIRIISAIINYFENQIESLNFEFIGSEVDAIENFGFNPNLFQQFPDSKIIH